MALTRYLLGVALFFWLMGHASAQVSGRILVGYAPGGSQDGVARLVAGKLSEALGRTFVVENRTGASGQIAMAALKAAPADGNTLMVAPDSLMTLAPHTTNALPYDPLNDFLPVAHVGSFDYALAVNANVPARNLGDWIAWVKASKANASFGSPGAGAAAHFVGFMLAEAIEVELTHVPYRGVNVLTDLAGGQISSAIMPLYSMVPFVKSGKIRALAHSGGSRAAIAPEVPTFRELGFPRLEVSGWFCLVAKAGTPPDVVAHYNEIVIHAMRTAAVRAQMRAFDLDIREMSLTELASSIKRDHDRW